QLASQLKFAERRIAALEDERARLDADLASERAARQTAAGEASALKGVIVLFVLNLALSLKAVTGRACRSTPATVGRL
ncbi:MAG: DNA-binding protein, partial [Janthinobacterium lividum]